MDKIISVIPTIIIYFFGRRNKYNIIININIINIILYKLYIPGGAKFLNSGLGLLINIHAEY
jgi:hypothetical protein